MSSTRNLTVLYGVQVLQAIVYYAYIGIVFNNFGTIAKTILSLHYDPGKANLIGRVAPKVWTQDCRVCVCLSVCSLFEVPFKCLFAPTS